MGAVVALQDVGTVDVVLVLAHVPNEKRAALVRNLDVGLVFVIPVASSPEAREPDGGVPVLELLVVVACEELFAGKPELKAHNLDLVHQNLGVIGVEVVEVL